MVVDDEKAVRDVASRILDKFGYRSIPMASGQEAVQCFTRERAGIDAVITDMAMPGIDGPTLVKILRDIDPDVRIMGMSGHGETYGGGRNSWCPGTFLTKPFTVEKLLVSLKDLLHVPALDS